VYEALYPANPAVDPDFHRFEFFRPIDLTGAGFVQPEEPSDLWQQALGDQLYEFQ